MSIASFRFDAKLVAFLARDRRNGRFDYRVARAATLKNAIEALGVPHTEVGAVTVNGAPATLQRAVREGDQVAVFARQAENPEEMGSVPIFLADAHLGGLARFLRMLGFDTLHDNRYADEEIRRLAASEGRIVLTRDRELLKCREIARGCYVRALKPQAQLAEVAARYGLTARARPFMLCLRCNVELQEVDRSAVAMRVPPKVLEMQHAYRRCPVCDGVFWPGSHYERMREALRRSTGLAFP